MEMKIFLMKFIYFEKIKRERETERDFKMLSNVKVRERKRERWRGGEEEEWGGGGKMETFL